MNKYDIGLLTEHYMDRAHRAEREVSTQQKWIIILCLINLASNLIWILVTV